MMNQGIRALVLSALGVLTVVGCGGSGGGGGSRQVFPSGFYAVFDSTLKLSYMSGFDGADWNKQSTGPGIIALNFDPAGNMLGANIQNNNLIKFTNPSDLSINTTFGTQGSGDFQFNIPSDVVVDEAGRIYVADSANRRIVRMDDFTGAGWTTLDVSSVVPTTNDTMDIALGPDGKIYFSVRIAGKICRADDMSDSSIESYTNSLSLTNDIKLDSSGRIYVVDASVPRVVRIDNMTGANRVEFGSLGSGVNQFSSPMALALDGNGRIYVQDGGNGRICRFDDMTGTNWATFGTPGNGVGQFVVDGMSELAIKQ